MAYTTEPLTVGTNDDGAECGNTRHPRSGLGDCYRVTCRTSGPRWAFPPATCAGIRGDNSVHGGSMGHLRIAAFVVAVTSGCDAASTTATTVTYQQAATIDGSQTLSSLLRNARRIAARPAPNIAPL